MEHGCDNKLSRRNRFDEFSGVDVMVQARAWSYPICYLQLPYKNNK
jgi:hypothetical protein